MEGGDTKRQKTTVHMEKVENKETSESGSVDFAELRDDLFREAAKLVSDVPSTKIAIFLTRPPSESMDSFGYPSVNGVVKTFLEDNSSDPAPADDAEEDSENEEEEEEEEDDASSSQTQRFWWEDAKQFESMNPEELEAAYDTLARLSHELDARLRSQGSGSQQHLLGNDRAQPKP
ncbi:hypothetical protein CARUB_v10014769mg [Capsella rubella]|uniref:MADS-box domain-containing protein n=1 Tax=Capsella rubella TaxID=81985 RepID=R0HIN0_9BRAS|nr:uncharacterized protein LOC17893975 [Capsella rubella]EOA29524.1 hypothetical protein CARUB_v10014769mg [Capsella rubella]